MINVNYLMTLLITAKPLRNDGFCNAVRIVGKGYPHWAGEGNFYR